MRRMSNLLFIGDSYSSKTYTYGLEYALGEKIECVYLLKETNKYDDRFMDSTVNFVVSDSLDECVAKSEFIIAAFSESFPCENFEELMSKYNLNGKQIIKVNLSEPFFYPKEVSPSIDKGFEASILLISCPKFSQNYIIEMALNQMFEKENVRLKQSFSRNTSAFLKHLNDAVGTTSFLRKTMQQEIENCDLYIETIESDIMSLRQYGERLTTLAPEYIILSMEKSEFKNDVDKIFRDFEMCYGLRLNAIVCSQFSSIKLWNSRTDVLYNHDITFYIQDISKNIITGDLSALKDDLIDTISLPDGVDRI